MVFTLDKQDQTVHRCGITMSKSSKSPSTPGKAVFFRPLSVVSEVKSGYLYKSPPQKQLKIEKSWKKRFFVLFKISESHHQLMYFRSSDERKEPLGDIDLSRVSLLHRNPQHQPKWEWVLKTFKCSSSQVVYLKCGRRDYFLIGDTSEEMDSWHSVLFDALKDRSFKFLSVNEISNGEQTIEDISRPMGKMKSPSEPQESFTKIRSLSVPDVLNSNIIQAMNDQRPVSYPSKSNRIAYSPLPTLPIMEENRAKPNESSDSIYETMDDLKLEETTDKEVGGTLLRSVNEAFDLFRKRSSSLVPTESEKSPSDSEKKHYSSASSRSSTSTTSSIENLTYFNKKAHHSSASSPSSISTTSSMENLSTSNLTTEDFEERDIEINKADLKKYLTLVDKDGKLRVSLWIGTQQQTMGLFLKGDQILAVNDLSTVNLDEFNMLISKCLKDKVKVTILRLSGGHLQLRNSPCNS